MSMNNENAPFYEGQKIVRTGPTSAGFVHGDIYTAGVCFKSPCKCGNWNVPIMEIPFDRKGEKYVCKHCYASVGTMPNYACGESTYFAPINPYSSDATKELVENLEEKLGDYADQPVKKVVFNN